MPRTKANHALCPDWIYSSSSNIWLVTPPAVSTQRIVEQLSVAKDRGWFLDNEYHPFKTHVLLEVKTEGKTMEAIALDNSRAGPSTTP
jgi:hypothetical protein